MSGHVVVFMEGEEALHVELLDEDYQFVLKAVQLVALAYMSD
jgi:hypothetical protein